jgi:hypothetical protein
LVKIVEDFVNVFVFLPKNQVEHGHLFQDHKPKGQEQEDINQGLKDGVNNLQRAQISKAVRSDAVFLQFRIV